MEVPCSLSPHVTVVQGRGKGARKVTDPTKTVTGMQTAFCTVIPQLLTSWEKPGALQRTGWDSEQSQHTEGGADHPNPVSSSDSAALRAQLRPHQHPLTPQDLGKGEREAQLPFVVNTRRYFCPGAWGFQCLLSTLPRECLHTSK